MLGPLATARDTRGVARARGAVRRAAGRGAARIRASWSCSHVSWATGRVMDTAPLAASGAIVVLDGAQGLGAVPVDVRALGCDFYAASGQKWLCGPGGMGYLYANPELVPSLPAPWSGYHALEDPERALEPALWPDARRLDDRLPGAAPRRVVARLARRARGGRLRARVRARRRAAERLAGLLRDAWRERSRRAAAPRSSPSRCPTREAFAEQAAAEGIVIRFMPGPPLARASVGAWNSEEEIERLAELAALPLVVDERSRCRTRSTRSRRRARATPTTAKSAASAAPAVPAELDRAGGAEQREAAARRSRPPRRAATPRSPGAGRRVDDRRDHDASAAGTPAGRRACCERRANSSTAPTTIRPSRPRSGRARPYRRAG